MKQNQSRNGAFPATVFPVCLGLGTAIGALIHNIGVGLAIGAGIGTIFSLIGYYLGNAPTDQKNDRAHRHK